MRKKSVLNFATLFLGVCLGVSACAKPTLRATSQPQPSVGKVYSADANTVYYAIRWALAERGYPVGSEDLPNGLVSSAWVPTKADSHFVQPFTSGAPDYGATGSYHKLAIAVIPDGAGTRVEVSSHVKSLAWHMQSSGREEKAVLKQISNYLHSHNVEVTNVGVED